MRSARTHRCQTSIASLYRYAEEVRERLDQCRREQQLVEIHVALLVHVLIARVQHHDIPQKHTCTTTTTPPHRHGAATTATTSSTRTKIGHQRQRTFRDQLAIISIVQ